LIFSYGEKTIFLNLFNYHYHCHYQGERVFAIWNPPLKHPPTIKNSDSVSTTNQNDKDDKPASASNKKVTYDDNDNAKVNDVDLNDKSFPYKGGESVSTSNKDTVSDGSNDMQFYDKKLSTDKDEISMISETACDDNDHVQNKGDCSISISGIGSTRPHEEHGLGSSSSSNIDNKPHTDILKPDIRDPGAIDSSSSSRTNIDSQSSSADETTGSWKLRNHTTDIPEVTQSKLVQKRTKRHPIRATSQGMNSEFIYFLCFFFYVVWLI
jgi:hypothetical protein